MAASANGNGRGPQGIESILSDEVMAAIRRPTAEARSLPNAAYTSAEFLRLENERLFARTWVLAGFGGQIPNAGDAIPVSVAGAPLILVRDGDGAINAFHNVCPHRGSKLLDEPCQAKSSLSCPYHGWTYGLDGALLIRPHFDGGDRHHVVGPGEADGLPRLAPARADVWQDLVFVNLAANAPPLEEHLAPMIERLAGYDLSELRYAGSIAFDVAANWKLVHENYMETYHVFTVHPALAKFVPMRDRQPTRFDGDCIHNEYRFAAPEEGRGVGLPHYPGLSDDFKGRGLWFHFFPTLDLELWPDQFAILHVIPLAPDRTREEVHIYLMGDAADGEAFAAERERVFEMWRDLNQEDIGILERLQEGRQSPAYDGGSFSPYWEGATHHFARLVAERVRGND